MAEALHGSCLQAALWQPWGTWLLLLKERQVPLTCECAEPAHAIKRQLYHRSQQLTCGRISGFIIQGLIVAVDLKSVSGANRLVALLRLAANDVWLTADFSGWGFSWHQRQHYFLMCLPCLPSWCSKTMFSCFSCRTALCKTSCRTWDI